MEIILFLIIISLIVAVGFLFAFFWAVRNGQYEDDYTPSMRLLIDDDMLLPSDYDNKQNTELLSENTTQNGRSTKI